MNCPRCRSTLCEIEPGPVWLRHFVCDECWSAWRFNFADYVVRDEINPRIRYKKHDTWLEMGRRTREEQTVAA